jgi:hypothetical protein
MIYRFKSRADGDLIMMGATGDQVLRVIGKSPAPQGIIELGAMPTAVAAIEAAVHAEDAAHAEAQRLAAAAGKHLAPHDGVTLRQHAWPLVEMMKRSMAEGVDIVWGV